MQSSNTYVWMHPKRCDFNRRAVVRTPTATTKVCDHASTICANPKCIEGWSQYFHVHMNKTNGGRRLVRMMLRASITV